ncbi:hypothetical protein [Micromonospora ureilytica]|uniref:Uncharacterized protein n=1 Tax=Micromonospora ureilytica TaxID=709868 RepID=A0ABS0JA20_9ACTN|nr:hypothetical protein [Micromonospora ureilytica]MBG6063898.1 hypothetical protein [Micromonospora ureilytica]
MSSDARAEDVPLQASTGTTGAAEPALPIPKPRPTVTPASISFEPIGISGVAQAAVALAVSLGVLRLLGVAGGDGRLAVSILRESGYTAPIAAILIDTFPSAVLYSMLYLIEYRGMTKEISRASGDPVSQAFNWSHIALIGLGLLLFNFSVWYFFLASIAVFAVYSYADRRGRKRARKTGKRLNIPQYRAVRNSHVWLMLASSLIPSIISQVSSTTPWQSTELVRTSDGKQIVGVVLRVDERWSALLTQNPRTIEYIKTSSVESRQTCKPKGDSRNLAQFIARNERNRHGGVKCPE